MSKLSTLLFSTALLVGATLAGAASAAVTAEEAAALKSTLTPLGAEKAGNADGSIPSWTGGMTTPVPGFKNGGRRPDPFADERPLFTITAQNMDQYADRLTDGTKAMLQKYPNSYRLDVYKTHRTAAAPQSVYDNTFKNATAAQLVTSDGGIYPEGAFAGIPFPVPQNGAQMIWNHMLRWRTMAYERKFNSYLVTADGKPVLAQTGNMKEEFPYYIEDRKQSFDGVWWSLLNINDGPAIRAGEAALGKNNLDESETEAWIYLVGQRRVRKLPIVCCDVPAPSTAGSMSFDEIEVFGNRIDRFNWKIVGKQEMYIPYNTNRLFVPTEDKAILNAHHLNPDHVRWELHRVWVVEATLADGKRHVAPKSRYYLDEDTWMAVLGDRWDSNGQIWKMLWNSPMVMPDIPAVANGTFGFYDLIAGTWYLTQVQNSKSMQTKIVPPFSSRTFSPRSLTGRSLR